MIHQGDSLSVLRTLPENSVQCVVTSPPYWGLRRYDIPDIVFDGDPTCEHEWTDVTRIGGGKQTSEKVRWQHGPENRPHGHEAITTNTCAACGAWRGQLGQEPTPDLFIAHMVAIFREVRRVLRADGTCWLNIGDCYNQGANGAAGGVDVKQGARRFGVQPNQRGIAVLKPKDLVGIPWMLAFALRADGWYLRAENIWAKGLSFCESYAGSVMPESVTDRPTRSHEQVFLLTKSPSYFYDYEGVKENGVYPAGTIAAKGLGTREGNRRAPRKKDIEGVRAPSTERRQGGGFQDRVDAGYACYDGTRNLRTVWAIGVEPFSDAHFATFPPDLVYPCLKAGTSQKGACVTCGAPWERLVDYEPMPEDIRQQFEAARARTGDDHGRDDGFTTRRPNYQRKRIGERWEPTCDCETRETRPCVVLDPFAGSGTVGVACEHMRLEFIGIDLGYHEMSSRRIGSVAPLFGQAG